MEKDTTDEGYRKVRINIFTDLVKEMREMHKSAQDPRLTCELKQILSMGMETSKYTLKQFLNNDEEVYKAVHKLILGTEPAE